MSVNLGFQEVVISNVIEQKNGHVKCLLNPRLVEKAAAKVVEKVVAAKVTAKVAAKVTAKNLNLIIRLIIYFIIMINYNTTLY